MAVQDDWIDKLRSLPKQQQMLVKTLVDQLAAAEEKGRATSDWLGCLEHLHVRIAEEDISEARREMWANFPRDVTP